MQDWNKNGKIDSTDRMIDFMAYQDTFPDDRQTSGSPGSVAALLAAAIVLLVVLLRGCA